MKMRIVIKIALIIFVSYFLIIFKAIAEKMGHPLLAGAILCGCCGALYAIWTWKPKSEREEEELTITKRK